MLPLLVIALALGGQSPSADRLLTGTVLDPEGLPVATAEVLLRCDAAATATSTDSEGAFRLPLEHAGRGCRVTVSVPGFAPAERVVERHPRAPLVIRLHLPAHEEHLTVRGDLDSFHSPRAAALDGALVREFVSDADAMLEYARALAGSTSDRRQIVVDGARRATLPDGARIERLVVNADPYSAALAGLDGARLAIETTPLRRVWSYSANVSPGSIAGRHPLGTGHQAQTRGASTAIGGPLSGRNLAWSAGASHTRREQELPILATLPGSASGADAVSASDRVTRAFGTAGYQSNGTRVTVETAIDDSRLIGTGAGGLVAPEGATDGSARTFETHASLQASVGATVVNSSGTVSVTDRKNVARSTARGTSFSGGAVGGGAPLSSDESHGLRGAWNMRAEGRARGKPWRAGLELSASHASEAWTPNAQGTLFLSPAADGTAGFTFLVWDRGAARAEATTRSGAAYGEVQWLRTAATTLTSGLRLDVATRDTLVLLPRLSASVRLGRGQLLAGAGRFVEEWAAETLLPLHARAAADHWGQTPAASDPSEILRGTTRLDIARQRQTVASIGIAHPVRALNLSGEYRWTMSGRTPSLSRNMTGGGWVEAFASDGRQRQHELRTRVGFGPPARALVAHYTWRRARETTDGWYGSPISEAGTAEWAPAANIPHHEAGVVYSVRTRAGTSVSAVGSFTSGRPIDLVYSPQTLVELLTAPRRPGVRNAGTGPGYASMTLYASQRIGLPLTRARGRLGLQVTNVLGRRNLLAPVTVVDSPLYGRATAAAPGRALGLWFSLERR